MPISLCQVILSEDHLPLNKPHENFKSYWDLDLTNMFYVEHWSRVDNVHIHRLEHKHTISIQPLLEYMRRL